MNYDRLPESEQIRRLKDDLWFARRIIVSLTPEAFQEVFRRHSSCETREQSKEWEWELIKKAVEIAVPLSEGSESSFPTRAVCPLCGDRGSSVYTDGFALPEGLSRHLEGRGNVRSCSVLSAALAMARDHFNDKFASDEAADHERRSKEMQQRRSSETLYVVDAGSTPLLLDESVYRVVRTNEELSWAEQRLTDLGFTISLADRIKRYTLETPEVVVYADPRIAGEITFRAYTKPLPKSKSTKMPRVFVLKDNWKNDLKKKFETWLAR